MGNRTSSNGQAAPQGPMFTSRNQAVAVNLSQRQMRPPSRSEARISIWRLMCCRDQNTRRRSQGQSTTTVVAVR
ncbi:unnamed protein product [Caenorhabditis auriculariae]|uniref:Uncharacterized protein n=1 Tax=Caenorhabditis auriculariae TaxID=2777116 RepID=A0A8S1H1U4_9PELO|nr:unnamed protein product [Caenorhabditis auriculariae]